MSLVIRHQVNTTKAKSSLMFQGEGQMLRGTCRRGSGQLPEESDSPRPVELTCPWASEGTGPAAAGYLHIQSLECPRLHSDTHPAEKPNDLMNFYQNQNQNQNQLYSPSVCKHTRNLFWFFKKLLVHTCIHTYI